MKTIILLILLLTARTSFAVQGFAADFLRLNPGTLTSTCRTGDLSFDSVANLLNYCSPTNTWNAFSISSTSPMTTLGDLVYFNTGPTRLPGNTTTSTYYLSQTGTGSVSAPPAWSLLSCSSLSNASPSCSTDTTNASNISSGTLAVTRGGTGQTSVTAAFDALSPTNVTGDMIYFNGTHDARLGIGSTGQVLNVSSGGSPAWTTNISGNAQNVNGTVAIGNGGTGQTSQQTAINALTGTQSAGKYLRSDGSNATLTAIQAADVPTLNQSTTGTAANVTGIVAILNGGTGQSSQTSGFDALSPTTTKGDIIVYNGTHNVRQAVGTDGYVLSADSTQATGIKWVASAGGGGNVTSSSTGVERVERAHVSTNCTSSPCTLESNTPGVTSITRSGTGSYAINFSSGVFTAKPTCTCTLDGGTAGQLCTNMTQVSATQMTFTTENASFTAVDGGFFVLCQGPH